MAVALVTACEYNDTRGSDTDGATGAASSGETDDAPEPAAVTDAASLLPDWLAAPSYSSARATWPSDSVSSAEAPCSTSASV